MDFKYYLVIRTPLFSYIKLWEKGCLFMVITGSENTGFGSTGSKNSVVGKHMLSITQRQDCKITGVIDVHAFDETNILMETVDGMLAIKGNGLHVSRLNLEKGEADVDGKVDSFVYSDKNTLAKKGEGLLTRLFS